jgi:hypothetical protein
MLTVAQLLKKLPEYYEVRSTHEPATGPYPEPGKSRSSYFFKNNFKITLLASWVNYKQNKTDTYHEEQK